LFVCLLCVVVVVFSSLLFSSSSDCCGCWCRCENTNKWKCVCEVKNSIKLFRLSIFQWKFLVYFLVREETKLWRIFVRCQSLSANCFEFFESFDCPFKLNIIRFLFFTNNKCNFWNILHVKLYFVRHLSIFVVLISEIKKIKNNHHLSYSQ
jgi:hypothetical protein